jgi:hypothetical protein
LHLILAGLSFAMGLFLLEVFCGELCAWSKRA